MTHTEALLVLNAVPGLSNARIRKLIEHYGSPAEVLSLTIHQLKRDKVFPDDGIAHFIRFPRDEFLKKESDLMNAAGVGVIVWGSEGYPELLREIPDAPVVLYVKGKIPSEHPAIGIVGSRRSSLYGREVAEQFARRFAEIGVTVVSGMARGIDTAAHQGCLKAGGQTAAVLGCGLSHVYPRENKNLMARIAANGAVISEFPMEAEPLAFNFPRRNRIISGLSLGTVVVEAAHHSGALITADFALEQGREVFAVPGPIGSCGSQGVHELIKNGAKLIGCVEDVLEELKTPLGEFVSKAVDEPASLIYKGEVQSALDDFPEPCEEDLRILGILNARGKHVDQIIEESELACGHVSMLLLQMEMRGLVKQLPGKFFRCVVRGS